MIKLNGLIFNNEQGVSPVVGVILMVAITVILSVAIGIFLLGIGQPNSTSVSQVNIVEENSNVVVTVNDMGTADAVIVRQSGTENELTRTGESVTLDSNKGPVTVISEKDGDRNTLQQYVPESSISGDSVDYDIVVEEGNSSADYQSIQPAINGASAGDTIYVRAGNYSEQYVSEYGSGYLATAIVNKSVTLIGSSNAVISYDRKFLDAGTTFGFSIEDGASPTIKGFTIHTTSRAYWIQNGDDVTINDTNVYNISSVMKIRYGDDPSSVSVDSVTADNGTNSAYIYYGSGTPNITVNNTTVTEFYSGVQVSKANLVEVKNSSFTNMVDSYDSASNIIWMGGEYYNTKNMNITISNVELSGSKYSNIYSEKTEAHWDINNVTSTNSEYTGIGLWNASSDAEVHIEDSNFSNNADDGVTFGYANMNQITVNNTTIDNNKNNGLQFLGSDNTNTNTNITISNVELTNSTYSNIYSYKTDATWDINNVTSTESGWAGIGLWNASSDAEVDIEDSEFSNNADDGMDIEDNNNPITIEDVIVNNNQKYGISATGTNPEVSATNISATGNTNGKCTGNITC